MAMLAVSLQTATDQASAEHFEMLAVRIVNAATAERESLLARDDLATVGLAQELNAAGARARVASECGRSLIAFQAAEVVARKIQAAPEIGRALNGRADCLFVLTDLAGAMSIARESVGFHEGRGDPGSLAEAWNTIANIYFYQSDYENALAASLRTRELWMTSGDRLGVGRSANNIGNIYRSLGQFDAAAKYYDEGLAIFDDLGDRRRAGVVSSNIALVHFNRGDYPKALAYATRSLDLAERGSDRGAVSKALDTLGNIYRAQGAYSRALRAFRRSLEMRKAIGDRYAAAESETNIGLVHFSHGDDELAIEAYKRGLRLAREAGTAKGLVSESLLNIARAAWRLGQKTRARANVRASVEIAEREGWPTVTAAAAHALGVMALADGRHSAARVSFQRALALREGLKDDAGVAESLNGIAGVLLATGQAGAALDHARRATGLAERYGQVELLWESRTLSGMAERRLGDAVAARASFTEAIDLIERLRREVGGRPLGRERFFESKLSPYHELIALLLASGDVAGALTTAERAKARVLADLLQDRAGPGGSFALADATSVVNASTAILEYVITDDTASLFVLSKVNGRTTLEHFVIPSRAPALAARVRRFRDRLASRDLLVAQDARALHDLLLAPAASRLAGKSHLIVVPDGPLWEVPFQALQDRANRYIVETAAVSYAPSLTVLRETLRRRPVREGPPTLLAMGNALPEAEAQVAALRGVYGARSRIYVGADATERRFKSEAAGHRLIHVASHGVFDQDSPRYSHLVLSRDAGDSREDGLLEAWELANLELAADLVILSACDTGRGRIALGEGSVGTMWAVLAAGARAAVVSQWMVEASSTTTLMTAFHRRLAAGDGDTAGHLRRATLELIEDPRYRHPFYWAPFILVGNPF